jgi:hypothetical protein
MNTSRNKATFDQYGQAKRAHEVYHIIGTPTIELLKTLIKMNAIKNCPVMTEDVNNAMKIFGANMLSLRGKSTDANLPW